MRPLDYIIIQIQPKNFKSKYTFSFCFVSGILTDVETHFNLSDDKGGLLQTAFVVSYMVFAPLFGYMGDRYSRRAIMAAGVFLWSITTLLGSFMDVRTLGLLYLELTASSLSLHSSSKFPASLYLKFLKHNAHILFCSRPFCFHFSNTVLILQTFLVKTWQRKWL